jgi:hypothetical protein
MIHPLRLPTEYFYLSAQTREVGDRGKNPVVKKALDYSSVREA